MANLTDHAEKLILDWLLTTGTATRPAARYVALFTDATDDSGGGTELVGNGYARLPLSCDAASSPGGTTSNNAELLFTAAGGDWGTVTHIAIYDAITGGNPLFHGSMVTPTEILDGQTLVFSIGNVDLTLA